MLGMIVTFAIGLAMVAFMVLQIVLLGEYFYRRYKNPDTPSKFPVLPLVVVLLCVVCVGSYVVLGVVYPLVSR